MVTDCLTEEAVEASPDAHKTHKRRRHHADLHLRGEYMNWSAEEMEKLLDQIHEDAIYIGDFAMEMSRQRNRPVLILCNARSGSYFHPAIINGLERLVDQTERDEFASEVTENHYWKQPGGKRRAVFETAQQWIEEDRIPGFVYSTREIKISSYMRNQETPVMATPHGLDELIERGCDIVFADYSDDEFPGSFARIKSDETWKKKPGFKEFLKEKSKRYKVLLGSRRQKKRAHSPDTCLKKALRARGPVAVCLNPLKGKPSNKSDVYELADNSPALLGEYGHRMGHYASSAEDFTPVHIQTSAGKMELDLFVRQYLSAR